MRCHPVQMHPAMLSEPVGCKLARGAQGEKESSERILGKKRRKVNAESKGGFRWVRGKPIGQRKIARPKPTQPPNQPGHTGGEEHRCILTPDSDGPGRGRARWPGPP